MGADDPLRRDWIEARAGAPLRGGTIDCVAIPDAAMTLAITALFAQRADHADQHRQLAREGNRPDRGDGHRAAQARRDASTRAPTGCGSRRRPRCDAGDHRHLRRPPDGDVLRAGRARRRPGARSTTRVACARRFPAIFTRTFADGRSRRAHEPGTQRWRCQVDRDRRPGGRRARGRSRPASPRALGFHYLDSGSLYRLVALKALRDGHRLRRRARAGRGWPRPRRPRSTAGTITLDGADATAAIRSEDVSAGASQVAVHGAVRAGADRAPAGVPPAAGPGRRRARHGDRRLPRRRASRSS